MHSLSLASFQPLPLAEEVSIISHPRWDSGNTTSLSFPFTSSLANFTARPAKILVAPQPFSKGGQRAGFKARLEGLEDEFVLKVPIREAWPTVQLVQDLRMLEIAQYYASLYNREVGPESKQVRFLSAALVQFTRRQFLPGEFVKHNNNLDFVAPNARQTPQAFSHYSFKASGGKLIVVDIQGVQDFYTDPQIHTLKPGEYGGSSLGPPGIRGFFSSHVCNGICHLLGLPNYRPAAYQIPGPVGI